MIYPENFEQKIGFDKIRELIVAKCLSSLGEEKTGDMSFSDNYERINTQLHQTGEFVRILQEEDSFPANHFFDVRDSLKKIRIEGTYLVERELFDIRRSLQTINEIIHFFQTKEENGENYPYLNELAVSVHDFPQLTKQIDLILDKFGRIKDNASAELSRIRKDLNQTMGSISKTLQSILRSAQSEGLVDKDVSPTMRDGRLVIPIAPGLKRKLKGIVHDESASGKTVFIEPAEVVEANNRVRELESEEKREIIRILTAFTNLIRPEIPEILNSYNFLAEIDFIRAKAIFSIDIQAILPVFENNQQIIWTRAIHPLLFLSLRKQGKSVVPLDIELGIQPLTPKGEVLPHDNENLTKPKSPSGDLGVILLISGPNAGGKSVCLKTVGLLQYMLQCGMLIPLYENSKTGIFKDIFIDIGDEQSIENDLSTYSSHLTNMKFFLRNCSPNSLILIDEFGGGTEPQIGGAIAESILERFNRKKSFGVITTHYQNLKHYAEEHEGVVNGAMLYDRHEMQPLFKLAIGNPGSSFAIEIARKIGLPEDVIADASTIVGQDYINMDKYLQDIVRDKRYWESKRQNIRLQEKRLEELTSRYESDLQKVNAERKEIVAKAKTEAERILADTNARIENVIREIREAQAEKEQTKLIRKSLNEFKETLQTEDEGTRYTVHGAGKNTKNTIHHAPSIVHHSPATPIGVGDAVRIKGQNSVGEVLDVQGKNIVVAFGSIKSSIKSDRLEKISKNQLKKTTAKHTFVSEQTSNSMHEKKVHFKTEIDLRGMRVDEALQAVTYYIDDAIQCNIRRVRILHGTGTGALRQVVRDYLAGSAGVRNYHDEDVRFGGAGITVVEFE
ncbi:MAG: Smr/MutS family protein [Candidatus Azobacteroides sp.]|nr:Smr/MutS family protein [Candidatus Azobacteroides sp.]